MIKCFQFCFNFAFNFNLCHYNVDASRRAEVTTLPTAGPYTRPLLSSMSALEGLITQETRRLTIDLSRANTLQGLTLVHFSAQRKHYLWDASGGLSTRSV